jgi:hypothetical protein
MGTRKRFVLGAAWASTMALVAARSVAALDEVETRLGTLKFSDEDRMGWNAIFPTVWLARALVRQDLAARRNCLG